MVDPYYLLGSGLYFNGSDCDEIQMQHFISITKWKRLMWENLPDLFPYWLKHQTITEDNVTMHTLYKRTLEM